AVIGGGGIRFHCWFFFFQAEDGIRDRNVTGVQTCALPIFGIAIGAASNFVLCSVLVPSMGLTGAALSIAASNGLAFLYRTVTGQMYYRTIPSFAKTVSGFLLAFAVTVAGTLLLQHFVLKFLLVGTILFIYCILYRTQLIKLWQMGLGILRSILSKK